METDEEQLEKLKSWFREYGLSIVVGVVIGTGSLFGYRYWVDYGDRSAEAASAHFAEMIQALEVENDDAAARHAESLLADYAGTDYAIMAHLTLARLHVYQSEFAAAAEQLRQVVATAANQPLGYLARKRLAAIQLQMSQPDQALTTLSADFPAEFSGGIEELKGDVYAVQGRVVEAAEAYRRALSAAPGPANREFLQQKLDDLGVTG